jgi:hypothetical protein
MTNKLYLNDSSGYGGARLRVLLLASSIWQIVDDNIWIHPMSFDHLYSITGCDRPKQFRVDQWQQRIGV